MKKLVDKLKEIYSGPAPECCKCGKRRHDVALSRQGLCFECTEEIFNKIIGHVPVDKTKPKPSAV